MSAAPWEADRELTADQVCAAIGGQFPDLAPVHATVLGSGWDNDVWRVNEVWAFKLPRKQGAQAWLEREIAMMPMLAEILPLPVPLFEHLGRPCDAFPHRFGGYRVLPEDLVEPCAP